jgi:hypothetical protein
MMMSEQKVDVLAVLDEAQDWLYRSSESRGDDERAEALKQARAAVAELIATAQVTVAAFEALGTASGVIANIEARRECEHALIEQKAALAAIGPQS